MEFPRSATLPGQAIVDLARTPGIKIRLLNTGDAVAQMNAKFGPFYFVASIPKGMNPVVEEDVRAAAGKTLFVADDNLEESRAHEITKSILEHVPEIATALAAAKEINLTNAVLGSSIPFHPGALRYYKEKGIAVPP